MIRRIGFMTRNQEAYTVSVEVTQPLKGVGLRVLQPLVGSSVFKNLL